MEHDETCVEVIKTKYMHTTTSSSSSTTSATPISTTITKANGYSVEIRGAVKGDVGVNQSTLCESRL